MSKLEQAARALLAHWDTPAWKYLKPTGDLMADLREALAEQAEQEPVAVVEITYGREPECYVTGNIDDFPEGVFKLYAAPVRTKDLTDDEIYTLYSEPCSDREMVEFARAVIAADREKNK